MQTGECEPSALAPGGRVATIRAMPIDRITELRRVALVGTLRQCRLFSGLPESDLAAVADACSLRAFAKGEYVFHEGDRATGFYVVQTGVINIHRITPDGKEQVICLFRPHESFAEATLATIDTYPANAAAVEPSQVLLVRKPEFKALILRSPDLALRMLASMSLHLRHLVEMIEGLKGRQIEARLAAWLLQHRETGVAQDNGGVVDLPVSKKMLAGQLGVTSETFSRTLARFRDEGLITVNGRRIELLDLAGLELWAGTGAVKG